MGHAATLGAAIAMTASLIAAQAEARPVPRERPDTAIPLARPEPGPAANAADLRLPRSRPALPSMHSDAATGSLGRDTRAARHEREALCLAQAIYFEARSEPIEGQFAVARVVLNRTASRRYPDTICGVVYQNAHRKHKCQFSFACDGESDDPDDPTSWALARGMAEALLRTAKPVLPEPVLRSTHYHADYVRPSWARKLTTTGQVGQHIFYLSARAVHVSTHNPPTKSASAGYLRGQWR